MKRILTSLQEQKSALLGIGVLAPGSYIAELIGRLGLDWAVVDLQHGANTWETLLPTLQGLELAGTPALVRVGWPDPQDIMRALDLGAEAVVVPMVDSVADARLVADAAKYPPVGRRSMGIIRQSYGAGQEHYGSLCFAMIETVGGLRAIDDIAAVPGLDGIFLGPGDLSLSMGLPRIRTVSAEIRAAANAIVTACQRHNKISAAFAPSLEAAKVFRDLGMRLVSIGTDVQFMIEGATIARQALSVPDGENDVRNA